MPDIDCENIMERLSAADDWPAISSEERYARYNAAYNEHQGRRAARSAGAPAEDTLHLNRGRRRTAGGALDELDARVAEQRAVGARDGSVYVNDQRDISVGGGHGRSMGTMPTVPAVPGFSLYLVRLVAVDAGADERTAAQFLRGEPVRGRALRERLEAAAKKHAAAIDAAKTEAAISRVQVSDSDPGLKAAVIAHLRGADTAAVQLAGRGRAVAAEQLSGRSALHRGDHAGRPAPAAGKDHETAPRQLSGRADGSRS